MTAAPLFESETHVRQFAASLRTQNIGKRIDFRERAGSTNDLALEAARAGAPHGKLFIAELQDAGRGRRGRSWVSPPSKGLLFSVLIRLSLSDSRQGTLNWMDAADIGWVPLVAGLACAEAIHDACGLALTVKWPNDLVIPAGDPPGWGKLGGVLCESVLTQSAQADAGFIVVGIGVNVNHTLEDLPPAAKAPPSSLYLERAKLAERLAILAAILERLELRLKQIADTESNAGLKNEIRTRLSQWWTQARELRVQPGTTDDPSEDAAAGKFGGLDEFGRLRLIETSGRQRVFADAEVLSVT